MTKRCDLCDSTETIDNLDHGGPVRSWVVTEDGYDRCGRCDEAVNSIRREDALDDLFVLDSDWDEYEPEPYDDHRTP